MEHNVNVTRGKIRKAAFMVKNEPMFEVRAKPHFSSFWGFVLHDDCNEEAKKVKSSRLERRIQNNGGELEAMLYGPFPCRKGTYSLRSWVKNAHASDQADEVEETDGFDSSEMVKLLERIAELDMEIVALGNERDRADLAGETDRYSALGQKIAALENERSELQSRVEKIENERQKGIDYSPSR